VVSALKSGATSLIRSDICSFLQGKFWPVLVWPENQKPTSNSLRVGREKRLKLDWLSDANPHACAATAAANNAGWLETHHANCF
jgi:hypothetical protein